MTLTFGKRILRLISPSYEEERQRFRIATSMMMANAEDVTRTIRVMNGHASEHPIIQAWTKKQQSAP